MDFDTASLVHKPTFCVINVYLPCMFKCKMCYVWKFKGNPAVSFENLRKFIGSLAELSESKVEINFTGGEPLLRQDILDLISISVNHSLRTSLCTNGYLIDEKMAEHLANTGLNGLAISLDSLDQEVHDAIRGVEGSYKKVIYALDCLSKFSSEYFKINIQTLIMQQTLKGIVRLTDWVQKNNILSGIYYMAITEPLYISDGENWHRKEPYSSLWPQDIKKVYKVIDELIWLKTKKGYFKIINDVSQLNAFKSYFTDPDKFLKKISCNLGEYGLNVNNNGDISPCFALGNIGNINEGDIKDMWFSQKANEIREKIRKCNKNCNYLINCYRKETADESELLSG